VAKWYAPLLSQLQGLGVTDADWSINTLVFVRSDQIDWLQERVRTWRRACAEPGAGQRQLELGRCRVVRGL
jgi:hypothetical protein